MKWKIKSLIPVITAGFMMVGMLGIQVFATQGNENTSTNEITIEGESSEKTAGTYGARAAGTAFAVYGKSTDTSDTNVYLKFYKRESVPAVGDTFDGMTVEAVYEGFDTSEYTGYSNVPWYSIRESITNIEVVDGFLPLSTSFWFYGFKNTTTLDLAKLDVSNVKNMTLMFGYAGCNSLNFKIIGLNNWNTSNVTNMSKMFSDAGYSATTFDIGDLSNWNTSKVTSMYSMFYNAGYSATTFDIGDLSNWNTSNVTNMNSMFDNAGYSATTWNIGDLSNWNTSNVTNMGQLFGAAGYSATTWNIGDLSNWNTSKVTSMYGMFNHAGYNSSKLNIGNLNTKTVTIGTDTYTAWDVSKVADMSRMFYYFGEKSNYIEFNLSNWDTSNVTNMSKMFYYSGIRKLDISNFNTSKTSSMSDMFTGMNYLEKITFGSKFSFNGSGYTRQCNLGSPSSKYITDATGYWYNNSTWIRYAPTSIPNNTAATYVAYPSERTAFAVYGKSTDTSDTNVYLKFYNRASVPAVGDTFDGMTVEAVYTGFDTIEYEKYSNIPWYSNARSITYTEVVDEGISPINTSYWFYYFRNCSTFELSKLDTSKVTSMYRMFYYSGYDVSTFKLNLSGWDVSNVTDMTNMFHCLGYKATSWTVEGLPEWNTENVIFMGQMFNSAGYSASTFELDLSGWDTSNVTNMYNMFSKTGYSASNFELDLSGFDTGNVTDMGYMFSKTGYSASNFELDLSGWDTKNVENTSYMFEYTGYTTPTFELDLSGWDTGNVVNMSNMFYYTGYSASNFKLDLSGWDTKNVENMKFMFSFTGHDATSWTVGDLSGWDTGNVTSMQSMFLDSGYKSLSWTVGDLSGWDTKNVTNMSQMFCGAGSQSLSWTVGDLSGWDTSNVTNMFNMFAYSGKNATPFELNLSGWDTKNVTNMSSMFDRTNIKKLDISGFTTIPTETTSGVSSMLDMFYGMKYLEEITVGEGFSFLGSGSCTDSYLPIPDSTYIPDAIGSWFNKETKQKYTDVTTIPNNTAATYVAVLKTPFAVYGKSTDTNDTNVYLKFYNRISVPAVGDTFDGMTVQAVYTGFDTEEYNYNVNTKVTPWYSIRELITEVEVVDENISPISLKDWFNEFKNTSTFELTKLDTSNVTSMYRTFRNAGYNVTTFEIKGISNWNTSNVTNMYGMFTSTGGNATTFDIGDISNWNTSKVENMSNIFDSAGYNATTFDIGNLNTKVVTVGNETYTAWDTKNVTNMGYMFYYAGKNAETWSIGDISNWNTSNVTDMQNMFSYAGYNATTFDIGNLNTKVVTVGTETYTAWDTKNVINMYNMFNSAGYNAIKCNIGDISNWNTSKVTNMSNMFNKFSYKTTTFDIGDLNTKVVTLGNETYTAWDTKNVTNMFGVLYQIGYNATTWNIGDISNWNTSKVTDMYCMFYSAGYNATTFDIGNLNTKVVTVGTETYTAWDTKNVINMQLMLGSVGREATSWSIGDISNWNTSKVTNMLGMFDSTGYNATTFDIGNLNTKVVTVGNETYTAWDTKNVTNMNSMFAYSGQNATNFNTLDLSNWNTSKVENMSSIFRSLNIKKLNIAGFTTIPTETTSGVTDMSNIFANMNYLEEVTVGEGFSFLGAGSCTNSYFPTPSTAYIPGANGNWYNNVTWEEFEPNAIPNETAATYVAVPPKSIFAVYGTNGDNHYLKFYNRGGKPSVGDTFDGMTVEDVYTGFEKDIYEEDYRVPWVGVKYFINTVEVVDEGINPISTSYWFNEFTNTTNFKLSKLDVSNVKYMNSMFSYIGEYVNILELDLSGWDTSNVESMSNMFYSAFETETTLKLDLSHFNVSNVKDMSCTFFLTGTYSTNFELDLSGWDTSNVESMYRMFDSAGMDSSTWSIKGLSNFNTSKVKDMYMMFNSIGTNVDKFELDLSGWNVSNVENMSMMFEFSGMNSSSWTIGDISNWNVLKVNEMDNIFRYICTNGKIPLLDLSGWDTSNTEYMNNLFEGSNIVKLNISNFNTIDNGRDFIYVSNMFDEMKYLEEITIGDKFIFNTITDSSCELPTPSDEYIPRATGKWYNKETGEEFAPNAIPNETAATYVAVKPGYKYNYIYVGGEYADDNNNGYTPETAVASLEKAYNELSTNIGGTIYVVGNVNISENTTLDKKYYENNTTGVKIEIPENYEVSIKRYSQPTDHASLDGFDVSSNIGYLITVSSSKILTLEDIVIDGHKDAVTSGDVREIAPGVESSNSLIRNSATLNINNATLRNNKTTGSGGAIYSTGKTTATGGKIYNNIAKSGAGICLNSSSTLTLSNIEIYDNTATSSGGGVYTAGKTTITSSKIYGNGGSGGAGIYASSNSTLELSDVEIYNNTASSSGGGIYAAKTLKLSDVEIYNNSATTYGGGIYSTSSTEMTSGKIHDNNGKYGGGIYYTSAGSLTLSGGEIYSNTATNGGGVNNKGSLDMTGGKIYNNNASYGAGIIVGEDATLTLSGGEIYGNSASSSGGAIYSDGVANVTNGKIYENNATYGSAIIVGETGSLTLSGGEIHSNTASSSGTIRLNGTGTATGGKIYNNSAKFGGAINVNTSGSLTLSGGEIYGNTATTSGGGIYSNGSCDISEGEIHDNNAEYGGAIFLNGNGTISNIEINNNNGTNGGGIYIAPSGSLELSGGNISENVANGNGKAIYLEGTLKLNNEAKIELNNDIYAVTDSKIIVDGELKNDFVAILTPDEYLENRVCVEVDYVDDSGNPVIASDIVDKFNLTQNGAWKLTPGDQLDDSESIEDTVIVLKESIKYTIKYNGNGSTSGTMEDCIYESYEKYVLSKNIYIKDGYMFNGWNTQPDGSGINYTDEGDIYNLTSVNNDIITLYAQWIIEPDIIYTVEHWWQHSDGDASIKDESNYTLISSEKLTGKNKEQICPAVNVYDGYKSPEPQTVVLELDNEYVIKYYYEKLTGKEELMPTLTREGYEFVGWYDNPEFDGNKISDISTLVDTSDYYDKWVRNAVKYTVKHWLLKEDGNENEFDSDNYELKGVESLYGPAEFYINSKAYDDLSYVLVSDNNNIFVDADGLSVINYYYKMNEYAYGIVYKTESGNILGTSSVECLHGVEKIVEAEPFDGYEKPESKVINGGDDIEKIIFIYKPIEYNITIDCAGGSGVSSSKYTIETETFELDTPSRSEYIFTGWTGSNGTTPQTSVSIAKGSTGDKTYTANWNVNSYTATFDANGGSTASPATITKDYNSAIGTLPTTSRTGYAFNGWYTDKTGGTKITEDTKVTANVTYYAQWTVNEYTYNIVYKSSSGTQLGTATAKYAYGTTNEIVAKDFNGYTKPANQSVVWDNVNAKTITFTYTPIEYNVTIDCAGGSGVSSSKYTIETATFSLGTPNRTGYTFTGWTGSNGSTPQTSVSIAKGSTGNKTYTANWSINSYTATFDANGGSTASPATITKDYNNAIGTLPTTSRTGYTFNGWYTAKTGGTKITTDTKVTANVTYYAQWTVNEYTYNIVYKSSSGAQLGTGTAKYAYGTTNTINPKTFNGYTSPATQSVKWDNVNAKTITFTYTPIEYNVTIDCAGGSGVNGSQYTIETATFSLGTPSRTGYTFTGWTGSNGSTPQTSVSIAKGSTGNKTYTANWSVVNYSITYNLDGGTNPTDAAKNYNIETAVTLPTPTKAGYVFVGWYTKSDFSDNVVTNIEKDSAGNKVFYAKWEIADIEVIYDGNGGLFNPDAGLYDENDNLIVSWDKAGIDIEQDYTYENYQTSTTSGYYVTQITYPDTRKVVIPDSVTRIENNAFRECAGLTSIMIPNSVTSIGDCAFFDCDGLTEVVIPDSVTSIGQDAFLWCTGLTEVVIGKGVTTIEGFSGCTGLTEIVIPDGVVSIGSRAFFKCTGLTSIVIPDSVTSIGDHAFYSCTGLTEVEFKDTEGWYVGSSAGATTTALSSSDLGNKSTAATYLKSTYRSNYWTKQ